MSKSRVESATLLLLVHSSSRQIAPTRRVASSIPEENRLQAILRNRQASKVCLLTKTRIPTSEGYAELNAERQKLPAWSHLHKVATALSESQVVIIDGPTGSGKSTQVPQACAHFLDGVPGMVLMTEPRRVAARSIAERLDTELGLIHGERGRSAVGLRTSKVRRVPDAEVIRVVTDGMVPNMSYVDPLFEEFKVVIIDEIHERSRNMDYCLAKLDRALRARSDLRLVLMSATADVGTLTEHFNSFKPVLVNLPGRQSLLTRYFIEFVESKDGEPDDNAVTRWGLNAAELTYKAIAKGDVLIFCPGKAEQLQLKPAPDIFMLFRDLGEEALNGTLCDRFQDDIRVPKILISTNVAETSLTFPHVKTVIDSGLSKIMCFDTSTGAESLLTIPSPRDTCQQRMGRTGRVGPGDGILLFGQGHWEWLPHHLETPPIQREDLTPLLLELVATGSSPRAERWIAPPLVDQWLHAVRRLSALEFLDENLGITDESRLAQALKIAPALAKMVIVGLQSRFFGDLPSVIAAAAVIEAGGILRPTDPWDAHDAAIAHRDFLVVHDQVSTEVRAFKWYLLMEEGGCKVAGRYKLKHIMRTSAQNARDTARTVCQVLKKARGVTVDILDFAWEQSPSGTMVPMVALAAWSHNLAFSVGDGCILVRDIIDGYYGPFMDLRLSKTYAPFVKGSSFPPLVVFYSLRASMNSRDRQADTYTMQYAVEVREEWIEEVLPDGKEILSKIKARCRLDDGGSQKCAPDPAASSPAPGPSAAGQYQPFPRTLLDT